jgi:excisionase family DNA binding protein
VYVITTIMLEQSPRQPFIPLRQRPTCSVSEACQAIGIGKTKLYELIGSGQLRTTTIGRRRLVLVDSLLQLVGFTATR